MPDLLVWAGYAVAFGGLAGVIAILRAAGTARQCQNCGWERQTRDRVLRGGTVCLPCAAQQRTAARAGLEETYRLARQDAWDRCLRGPKLWKRVGAALFYADEARTRATQLTADEQARLAVVLARVRDQTEQAEQEVRA